jgi:hypothetical protein
MSAAAEAEEDLAALRPRWLAALDSHQYVITRFVFLRMLGLVYAVAFLVAANQLVPLVGADGIEPAARFLDQVSAHFGTGDAFVRLPTVFWLGASDAALGAVSWVGFALALSVLFGLANAVTLFFLWLFYLSIVQVGQLFWGYGWESLLLETGFLAIFFAPPLDPRPFPQNESPPKPVVWLLRWVVFRLMLGAGLIKLRGDTCWRDLTCLVTHYETQPLPNPMSWVLNQLPLWAQKAGVLYNHFAELVAPFLIFGPRKVRIVGGSSIVALQALLIVSGNLSWLNWLTIAITVACFDDAAFLRLCPTRFRARLAAFSRPCPMSKARKGAVVALCILVGVFSLNPVVNLFSPTQRMNSSFDPLYLVNTYGAFGSVGRDRYEIILEGTLDDDPTSARWSPYEFRCKPGDVARRPCVVAPYQYRIDWQMWFAAMSDYRHDPWIVHFVYKLLSDDRAVLSLLATNPFGEHPPKWIRAELYRYRFTRFGDEGHDWWTRTRVGAYLPPLQADDPGLLEFLSRHGWL